MSENKLVDMSIIFIGLAVVFLALQNFQVFLRPFVIALILTFLFVPLTRLPTQKKKLMWISVAGVVLSLFLTTIVISALFVDDTTQEQPAQEVSSSIENLFEDTTFQLGGAQFDLSKIINLEEITQSVSNFLSTLLSSIGNFFKEAMLVLLFLIFLLPTHDKTVNKIAQKLSGNQKKRFLRALEQIESSIRKYLTIKSLVSLLTAFLSALVMVLFGVKYVVLFSILIFFLNFIPSIGSIVAVGAVLIFVFLTTPFSVLFILLGILLIMIQIVIGNIIEPKFAGKELELSPLIILLSLFFWGSVWGIGGMFFAVPLTSIIKIILQNNESTKSIVPYLS